MSLSYAFLVFYFVLSFLFSDSIVHNNIENYYSGEKINFNIYIDSDREIAEVLLMYKIESQNTFIEKKMNSLPGNQFTSNISSEFNIGHNINYFFVTAFTDGGLASYPATSPYENPLLIEINKTDNPQKYGKDSTKKPGELSDFKSNSLIISPIENSTVSLDDFIIVVSFFKTSDIDMGSVKVYIDEINVNEYINRHISHITCSYPFLKEGKHRIRIEMNNSLGQSFESFSWDFNIRESKRVNLFSSILNHKAKLWTSFSMIDIDGYTNIKNDINYRYNANLNWIKINSRGYNTSLEDSNKQTKNKFNISFSNNNFRLTLGDFYPQFNKFSVNGAKVRGVGINFSYPYLNLNIVNGELLHEIQGKINENSMLISEFQQPGDTTNGFVSITRNNYTFQRDLKALRLGFRFPKRVNINFDIAKINDNTLSVYNYLPGSYIQIPEDMWASIVDKSAEYLFSIDNNNFIVYENFRSNIDNLFGSDYDFILEESNWYGNKPKDNILLGSDLTLKFDKQRLILKAGCTFSLLNQNTWEKISDISQLDTLSGDTTLDGRFLNFYEIKDNFMKYDDIFELGINQVPLIPVNFSEDISIISEIFNLPSVVYDLEARMKYAGHDLLLKYLQVGPEYTSLANQFIQNDIREKSVSDRFRLLGNRLVVNTGWMNKLYGIRNQNNSSLVSNKFSSSFGFYPGSNLPTFRVSFTSVHMKGEKNRIDQLIISDYNESQNDTVITDNRLETLQKQVDLVLTNSFELFGLHQMSINIFNNSKEDLVYEKKIALNPNYYSPSSKSFSTNMNLLSKHSSNWESNLTIRLSEFENGNTNIPNLDYYHKQTINQLSFKLTRKNWLNVNNFSMKILYSYGDGSLDFIDLGYSILGEHELYDIFDLRWQYNLNRKSLLNTKDDFSTSFKAQLIYNL